MHYYVILTATYYIHMYVFFLRFRGPPLCREYSTAAPVSPSTYRILIPAYLVHVSPIKFLTTSALKTKNYPPTSASKHSPSARVHISGHLTIWGRSEYIILRKEIPSHASHRIISQTQFLPNNTTGHPPSLWLTATNPIGAAHPVWFPAADLRRVNLRTHF